MPSDCPYCGEPQINFVDEDDGTEMWIEKTFDGNHVISVDSPYVWSIPINFCPFCGRKLEKVKADAN